MMPCWSLLPWLATAALAHAAKAFELKLDARVPAGDHLLHVWHAGLRSGSSAPTPALHVGAADLSPELRLDAVELGQ